MLMFAGVAASAQQRHLAQEKFLCEMLWNVVGDYEYNYIVGENGARQLDGPFSMTADFTDRNLTYEYVHKMDVAVKYSLTGANSVGYLHGPLTMQCEINFNATNGYKSTASYLYKGNFKNGLPDGNFNLTYIDDNTDKVNVNYKDGILVGSYYINCIRDNMPVEIVGNLTQDGKPDGIWSMDFAGDIDTLSFQNGVLVSSEDYNDELLTKARQYASGAISEKDLNNENIHLIRESLLLGEYAYDVILRRDGINYDKLGGYSFTDSKEVSFVRLYQLPMLTDEGYQMLKDEFLQAEPTPIYSEMPIQTIDSNMREYNGRIAYSNDAKLHYICIGKETKYAQYCTCTPDWSHYVAYIYLTEEQMSDLNKALHDYRILNAVTATKLAEIMSLTDDDVKSFNTLSSNMTTCKYDSNYYVYYYELHKKFMYVDAASWEELGITTHSHEKILEMAPESRKAKLQEKITAFLLKEREDAMATCKAALEGVKGQPLTHSAYRNSDFFVCDDPSDVTLSCSAVAPIVSYEIKGAILDNEEDLDRRYKVNVILNVGKEDGAYSTYDTYLYLDNMGRILQKESFDLSKATYIRNKYDDIAEIKEVIESNAAEIRKLTLSHSDIMKSYQAFHNSYDMNPDHSDLDGTINRLNEFIKIQNDCKIFITARENVLKEDLNVKRTINKCADVSKAYSTYMKSVDLDWTPDGGLDKIKEVAILQEQTRMFVAKREEIEQKHLTIIEKSSDIKDIYKSYQSYMKTNDLSWSPEVDLEKLYAVIEVQDNTLVFIEKRRMIDLNNKAILEKGSTFNDFVKEFSNYLKSDLVDMTWTPFVLNDKLDALIAVQDKSLVFIEHRQIIMDNTTAIHEKAADLSDLVKEYNSYIKSIDVLWTPDVDIQKLKNVISIQDQTFNFIAKRSEIEVNEVLIHESDHKDVIKAYQAYEKSVDLTWTPEVNVQKLDNHIIAQMKTMEFIEKRTAIENNESQIESATHKDVVKSYDLYMKERDLSWDTGINVLKLDEIIAVQKKTIEFIELRDKVSVLNEELKQLSAKGRNIYKAYTTYMKYADLTWTELVDKAKIEEIISLQESCKDLLTREDVKDIDDTVRKEKIVDIYRIISLFS